jgi:hypothetical protein
LIREQSPRLWRFPTGQVEFFFVSVTYELELKNEPTREIILEEEPGETLKKSRS